MIRRDRKFIDTCRKLDLSGGEAELADWFASRYGIAGDAEELRWLLLYFLYRHFQGDLLIPDPAGDDSFKQRFVSMAPTEDTEMRTLLGRKAEELSLNGNALISRNQGLFSPPGGNAPVVSHREALRFRRFWNREESLLGHLKRLTETGPSNAAPADDPLKQALELLKTRKLLIISGGPGTGKTTLIGRLVKSWIAENPFPGKTPRIVLAAPTGRAASRLMETLPAEEGLPAEAQTLHKLLGFRRGKEGPARNRDYPLSADLVIVDEASMIDFNLMEALFDALPEEARLVLVGDKDQLPSVGAGALFSDFLEGSGNPGHRFQNGVILLSKMHRSIPGISLLAEAVRNGEIREVFSLLKAGDPAVTYQELPETAGLPALLESAAGIRPVSDKGFPVNPEKWESVAADIGKALERMGDTGILTPVRKGLFGTGYLNALLEKRTGSPHERPVMMTVNNYELELYNGDRGMIFLFNGTPLAFFRDPSGKLRHFPPSRLDGLETCYVQTVHKSQGSEFRQVYLFFPEVSEGLQIREILYTGITRARERITLYSSDPLVEKGISRRVTRESRIRDFLAGLPVG